MYGDKEISASGREWWGSRENSSPITVGVGPGRCCGSLRRVKYVETKILCLPEENDLTLSYGGIPPLGRGVREREGAAGGGAMSCPEVTQGAAMILVFIWHQPNSVSLPGTTPKHLLQFQLKTPVTVRFAKPTFPAVLPG